MLYLRISISFSGPRSGGVGKGEGGSRREKSGKEQLHIFIEKKKDPIPVPKQCSSVTLLPTGPSTVSLLGDKHHFPTGPGKIVWFTNRSTIISVITRPYRLTPLKLLTSISITPINH